MEGKAKINVKRQADNGEDLKHEHLRLMSIYSSMKKQRCLIVVWLVHVVPRRHCHSESDFPYVLKQLIILLAAVLPSRTSGYQRPNAIWHSLR